MAEIQRKVIKLGKRNVASRVFHAKVDRDKIAAWRYDLVRVLHVFNVRLIGFRWVFMNSIALSLRQS